MQDVPPASTRRGLLRSAALLAVGAVAAGVGLQRTAPATEAAARSVPAAGSAGGATTLMLHGRGWYLTGAGHRQGAVPQEGERGAVSGELVDPATGDVAGTFRSACFHGGRDASDLELQTFDLGDGMLVGMGASRNGEGTYAVIGGTGRFAGARGTYVARQGHREVGGDGEAAFAFTFLS